ncbi:DUF3152 domain-containing protein [Streptomyces sp. BPTC-684]|uniref:DUF3152 domain-containing protein n=1 Tax=Streptomyces sp. BPTC-684 TaxID=3043734 RepID=UPI0024B0E137|nr:DUF3152 domain-containing protein [Streptomyces sp. BPTC-684]WHM36747.1 DUF3152 domain-containing protein [Streptomyces sp. BPTC-684]
MGRHSRPKGASGTPESTRTADTTGPVPVVEGVHTAGGRRRADGPPTGQVPRIRPVPGDPAPQHYGGTPAHGVPQVRGGHPEHHEGGGGWGEPAAPHPGDRQAVSGPGVRIPGPRREYVDAFDGADWTDTGTHRVAEPGDTGSYRRPEPTDTGTYRRVAPVDTGSHRRVDPMDTGSHRRVDQTDTGSHRRVAPVPPAPRPVPVPERVESAPETETAKTAKAGKSGKGSKGRTLTGIAAAAVTTVLAVVVAGQVTADGGHRTGAQSADDNGRGGDGPASRSKDRATPEQAAPAKPASYEQKMALQYPIDPKLKGSGEFEAVPGFAAAPGKGRKYRYRVDVEKGLGLDGGLFAEAVQKTLNDDRSWAHAGAMTFERISSGKPDFVITLASPGTTATWCGKSGLDTTVDNVSCDSAATDRVMINAFRWAQGSTTFGAQAMYAYRQMLINHEVGHRLGHSHVSCRTPGALAPVMQQQTKSLDIDGIKCRPNPWVYPTG